MNCPFCRIAKGELFAHLLYEDDQVLSFLDAAPMAPGHALIVPRAHVERFTELSQDQACRLFIVAVLVGKALAEALAAPGFTVGLNDGLVAGQGVPPCAFASHPPLPWGWREIPALPSPLSAAASGSGAR
jgi:histidine triad (HIT) family protein